MSRQEPQTAFKTKGKQEPLSQKQTSGGGGGEEGNKVTKNGIRTEGKINPRNQKQKKDGKWNGRRSCNSKKQGTNSGSPL